jgi:hypothetical protein
MLLSAASTPQYCASSNSENPERSACAGWKNQPVFAVDRKGK